MSVEAFLSGFSMATFAATGVFFLKFWRASRDRFYLLFCFACWALAAERLALFAIGGYTCGGGQPVTEANSLVYLMRLTAFVAILVAVIDKNRKEV